MEFKIPFGGRAHTYTKREEEIVLNVMRESGTLTQGHHLKKFESDFEAYIGAEKAYAVNNATAALEIAAQLCQFEEGDEVIIPSHTFTSSAYPFAKQGGHIKWADIDAETRVVSAESIRKELTPKTKAIVVVHLYGFCIEMAEICKLAREYDLLLIEDVAQALGAEVNGQKAGTFGDFGIYSFHSHKNVSTLGEGGVLLVNNPKYQNVIPQIRHNGHCAYAHERENYWVPAMSDLRFPEIDGKPIWPNNYCLGEVEAALGSELLGRIDTLNAEKRVRANKFVESLAEYPELSFHKVESSRHTYHLLVAKCHSDVRDKFIDIMGKVHGVQCVVQYYPLNRYPLYESLGLSDCHCPNADDLFDNMVSFPFEHRLEERDINYIIDSAKKTLDEIRLG
ncbi:DegT/DnrJ/EryC1/StrS family aminotransferase [Vibrio sp. YMD68]|uniref:DegT/DnrJ/EryC1/StrS family aminotransferase n=1 Tax=Vibrio sp. YMD68 TaxID=3042300 RepID=UPI00249B5293|nr:DegT/DnrJ/EryC1/StrS family aminotransferase [Vibrio sp. YMD68]WGW00505.1 DegT/DnrJ/EryC1/StrS family aminotransferase [Vibrio sp. YMD68]